MAPNERYFPDVCASLDARPPVKLIASEGEILLWCPRNHTGHDNAVASLQQQVGDVAAERRIDANIIDHISQVTSTSVPSIDRLITSFQDRQLDHRIKDALPEGQKDSCLLYLTEGAQVTRRLQISAKYSPDQESH